MLRDYTVVGGFNFRLSPNSPALGKGYIFAELRVVPVSPNFGSTAITPPNKDMGAYPSDNSGNQH
jgi:hypothetical protein